MDQLDTALIGAGVSVAGTGAVAAVPAVVRRLQRGHRQQDRVREAKRLLGLRPLAQSAAGYRSDSVHPLYRHGSVHPDNGDALVAVARSDIYRAAELDELDTREEVLL